MVVKFTTITDFLNVCVIWKRKKGQLVRPLTILKLAVRVSQTRIDLDGYKFKIGTRAIVPLHPFNEFE